ncbi:SGNH/GDSL hydrolase family protein OS=Streptomyces alboniger OX=132473 GN=CP975_10740 PE=4 SV=1 [Streptomyces alboniger]
MRKQGHRSRAVLAALAATVLGVTGCDAVGGNSPGPSGTGAQKAKPTPAWDSSPASVAAVGDSITRGFDACAVLTDCPEVSWATGGSAEVDSLAVRLLGRAKAAERSWNYAVTGARMADLPGQMGQAAARKPGLVAVMAGATTPAGPAPRR